MASTWSSTSVKTLRVSRVRHFSTAYPAIAVPPLIVNGAWGVREQRGAAAAAVGCIDVLEPNALPVPRTPSTMVGMTAFQTFTSCRARSDENAPTLTYSCNRL